MIGTIVKPSIGFTPEQTAKLVDVLCAGRIDFIKDDELQSDGALCPFEERVRAVMRVIDDHAERSGRKVMFAFNLTGEIDEMRRRHDLVESLGGTCVMASLNSIGIVGMIALGRHCRLPIHAHRNGWGYLSRHPALGWSYVAWQKIWRLAGVDHMHVNGLANKFSESYESVTASAQACLTPMFEGKPCTVMPLFSSGQSARQAAGTLAALGSTDLIFAAGGGIMAHPDGPAEGVRALRESFEAAMAGVPAERYASTPPRSPPRCRWPLHDTIRRPSCRGPGRFLGRRFHRFFGRHGGHDLRRLAGSDVCRDANVRAARTLSQLPSDRRRRRRPGAAAELDGRSFARGFRCARRAQSPCDALQDLFNARLLAKGGVDWPRDRHRRAHLRRDPRSGELAARRRRPGDWTISGVW